MSARVRAENEVPLDDGARDGTEHWRDHAGASFCHWDRWLLRLALDEPNGLRSVVNTFQQRAQTRTSGYRRGGDARSARGSRSPDRADRVRVAGRARRRRAIEQVAPRQGVPPHLARSPDLPHGRDEAHAAKPPRGARTRGQLGGVLRVARSVPGCSGSTNISTSIGAALTRWFFSSASRGIGCSPLRRRAGTTCWRCGAQSSARRSTRWCMPTTRATSWGSTSAMRRSCISDT